MNRTVRTLALAAPLAIAALSLGAVPAMADTLGPDQMTMPIDPDPEPQPQPDEEVPPQDDPERPDGPDEFEDSGEPCPTHGGSGSCGPDDDPGDEDDPGDGDDIRKPDRIDAGAGASDDDLELAWILTGGALVTAASAAMVARRRTLTQA